MMERYRCRNSFLNLSWSRGRIVMRQKLWLSFMFEGKDAFSSRIQNVENMEYMEKKEIGVAF